ncbi:RNA Hypothetical protein motif protein 33 [Nesidiocoris tenuis]|uniref:RRM domain-containing protein n=1 Tax=Nesidiocoris tenuis TaxID=355587 RepID=A0ABN7B5V8_9HEMI|nr:RNA Hypothetical protein motif protein 33 [Nesidiocoris tenuis]
MADHNDDLLDDDGLDPAFDLDLVDEDALLADDYEENPQSVFKESKRKVIERVLEDDDFIEIGIEEDIGEDVRHENSENGANIAFDEQNDSDDEIKERSRFKTERNITLTPSRSNKPIPETLDAVPVKTVGQLQSIRARLGPQPQGNRRGGGRGGGPNHFRGRGRGGGFFHHPPNHNFQNQQGFNNFQGNNGGPFPPPPPHQQNQYGGPPAYHMGGMPPPQHQYYGGGPPGPPPQHHVEPPPHMAPEQQNLGPQHYQMPPPHFQSYQAPPQQPQQQIPHQAPPNQQQTQPYYENAPPQLKPNQPPARIHVNPHFKNNLGNVWNGINNSWTSQQTSAPQQAMDQYQAPAQGEWADNNSSQDYYNSSSSQSTYNEYGNNQFYGESGQGYQQNNVAPQQYQAPPAAQAPVHQGSWESNHHSNYFPPAVHPPNEQYNYPPDQPPMVGNAVANPPPAYGPQHGPPPNRMGPPPGCMGGPRGPPSFSGPPRHPEHRGPIRGQHPSRGRPPMMGPPPKLMRPPFPSNREQNPPGNIHTGTNPMRPNHNQNLRMENNSNFGPRFRLQNPTPVRTTMVNSKQQRKETASNIVPIKTVSNIPPAAAPPEDEDEETKAYRKKIEAQKKLREDLLRQKEERRKVAIQQKLQQQEDGVETATTPGQSENPETTYKTVRIMQSDGTTVLRKLTLAQIAKLKKITPGAQAAKQTPTKTETIVSKLVSIENLSASTSYRLLMDMARTVGVVETVNLDSDARKAFIRFMKPEDAQLFVRRHHRKMVDLSMIQATVVPESAQSSKRS